MMHRAVMSEKPISFSRRASLGGVFAGAVIASAPLRAQSSLIVSLEDFGARPGGNARLALQRALDEIARLGGGTLRIGGTYQAGIVTLRGNNVTIDGAGGTLVDTRLVVAPSARNVIMKDLTLLETSGRADSYLLDVSGNDCRFINLTLLKEPIAGGYQAYVRGGSRRCSFSGLKLAGSNGIFVAGRDHLFEDFEFISTLRHDIGGDDAFAIKAPGLLTENITIRNGTVRGYAAAVSIGSEVGSSDEHRGAGIVRGVRVSNVVADRCQMVCFIKPGALIYDWRDGLVEDVTMNNIRLTDPTGFMFGRGIAISAGRGARIRGVTATGIVIAARSHTQGVMPTAAVDIGIRRDRPGSTIEDISLQLAYDGSGREGYPVDHIVRVEKDETAIGTMRDISIDVTGSEARIAGIHIGPGLDDAVTISRARLARVALDPPSSLGAAGIWSDSRLRLGDVQVEPIRGPKRGGRIR